MTTYSSSAKLYQQQQALQHIPYPDPILALLLFIIHVQLVPFLLHYSLSKQHRKIAGSYTIPLCMI